MARSQLSDSHRVREYLKDSDPIPPGATLTEREQAAIRQAVFADRQGRARRPQRLLGWWAIPGLVAAVLALAVVLPARRTPSPAGLPQPSSQAAISPSPEEAAGGQASTVPRYRQIQLTGSRGSKIVWFLDTRDRS